MIDLALVIASKIALGALFMVLEAVGFQAGWNALAGLLGGRYMTFGAALGVAAGFMALISAVMPLVLRAVPRAK